MVRQTPNAFGYVELIYAEQNKMSFGMVKNASAKFVKASTNGVTAAAAAAAKSMPPDYRISITNAPGPDSYPISSFTWLLIPTHSNDAAKTKALVGFLNWMLDHGQSEAASLTFAPLPTQVQEMVRKSVTNIK
jgi:phosphate transport system substrate-binding protein